jgi:hypothetical protein
MLPSTPRIWPVTNAAASLLAALGSVVVQDIPDGCLET